MKYQTGLTASAITLANALSAMLQDCGTVRQNAPAIRPTPVCRVGPAGSGSEKRLPLHQWYRAIRRCEIRRSSPPAFRLQPQLIEGHAPMATASPVARSDNDIRRHESPAGSENTRNLGIEIRLSAIHGEFWLHPISNSPSQKGRSRASARSKRARSDKPQRSVSISATSI